jgi:hypothetical protein
MLKMYSTVIVATAFAGGLVLHARAAPTPEQMTDAQQATVVGCLALDNSISQSSTPNDGGSAVKGKVELNYQLTNLEWKNGMGKPTDAEKAGLIVQGDQELDLHSHLNQRVQLTGAIVPGVAEV